MFKDHMATRRPLAAPAFALLFALTSVAAAQDAPQTPQAPAQTTHTQTQTQQPAPSAPAQASAGPLYREYRGVTLGMGAADVRARLGRPEEKSDEMDFFVFSGRERARVYYQDGKATAVIATYLGRDAAAPTPEAVLGTDIEARPDGSMYRMTPYPEAGYWVAYSRTAGDSPMVMITMQKSP